MSNGSIERAGLRADSVHPNGLVITEEFILQRLGMVPVVIFPTFETDAAGIVDHGEELEHIGKLCGFDNVIASLYFDEGKLLLGIFAKKDSIPKSVQEVSATISAPAPPELA